MLSDFEFTVCVCALVINSCKTIPEHEQLKWRKRFGMVMYARNFRTGGWRQEEKVFKVILNYTMS